MECGDYLEFQDYLKKSRDMDDKLIYMLNVSLPTPSFQSQIDMSGTCKDLYSKLEKNYQQREFSINRCISITSNNIQELKSKPDDVKAAKNLKNENKKLRLLRTELGVEEVVRERSGKLFYEKCRSFYKPETLSPL